MKTALPLAALLFLAGCATKPLPHPFPVAPAADVATVTEAFVAQGAPGHELDSLATWPTEDGGTWVIATAKNVHQLVVFDGDTGEPLRTVGGPGTDPGRFTRPNGLAIHGDLLFVSERDNRRVQVLRLPDFTPVDVVGEGELRSPYGVWVYEPAPGELRLYVTDSFQEGERFDVLPPLAQLDQRVRHYRLRVQANGTINVQALGNFGDTSPDNALRIVESIAGDPAFDRLMIADEDMRHAQTVQVYTLEGHYTGHKLPVGSFDAEPEGIALWACDAETGYWIVSDQLRPLTRFRMFDRRTLAAAGTFSGQLTAWTDGVALHAAATPRFPHGVLYAVHDDKAIAAFDLGDIATALQLAPGCQP
ncbi:phytase [Luteimonas aestuarii]|uniref:Phytase n=1 Tax=Luteimonas aestuarii TaxID=453837 RepID=A0A4R5TTU1_9GAMM|nr:phytase [Luteimonas aestuarii]TDK24441.1 phytase [Luteimonas aestuarii]